MLARCSKDHHVCYLVCFDARDASVRRYLDFGRGEQALYRIAKISYDERDYKSSSISYP